MRKVTVKALLANFRDLDPKVAKELVTTMNSGLTAKQVEELMGVANTALGMHGVESIKGNPKQGTFSPGSYWGHYLERPTVALYCNTGDTYATTLLYDTLKRKFMLTSWGDFVETAPKRYGLQEEGDY
jgi:hypothetical protein